MDGNECRHFVDLEVRVVFAEITLMSFSQDGNFYVAAAARMRFVQYGTRANPEWNKDNIIKYSNPPKLDSVESQKVYLYNNEFKPHIGLLMRRS